MGARRGRWQGGRGSTWSVLALAGLAACSSTSYTAASTDAGASDVGAGGPDAGGDAPGIDAPGVDAPADTDAPAADAAPSTWCQQPDGGLGHVFCADFDEGMLGLGWDQPPVPNNDQPPVLDTSRFTSPPASMFSLVSEPDGGSPMGARLVKHFSQTPARLELAFDVYVDQLSPARGDLFSLTGLGGTLAFAVSTTATQLIELPTPVDGGPGNTIHTLNNPVPVGRWARVDLTLTFTSGGATVTVTFDGTPALVDEPLVSAVAHPPGLYLGASFGLVSGAILGAHFDNLTFDISG